LVTFTATTLEVIVAIPLAVVPLGGAANVTIGALP